MAESNLERLQRLAGRYWTVSFEDGKYHFQPGEVRASMLLDDSDFAKTDGDLVADVIGPAIDNLEMMLDCARPYHETRHEQFIRSTTELFSKDGMQI